MKWWNKKISNLKTTQECTEVQTLVSTVGVKEEEDSVTYLPRSCASQASFVKTLKESHGTISGCTRETSRVQTIGQPSLDVLQAVDMRVLYSGPDVLSPSNCYQYQFTNINNHLLPSGPLFPDRLCTLCVSCNASVLASIKLLAALNLLTVIKNDLDVILYP